VSHITRDSIINDVLSAVMPRFDVLKESLKEMSAGLLEEVQRVRKDASAPTPAPVSNGPPPLYQTPRAESERGRPENPLLSQWTPQSSGVGLASSRFYEMVDYRRYIENKAVEDYKNMEARRLLAMYEDARFSSMFHSHGR
jgi:hypothetical protein